MSEPRFESELIFTYPSKFVLRYSLWTELMLLRRADGTEEFEKSDALCREEHFDLATKVNTKSL